MIKEYRFQKKGRGIIANAKTGQFNPTNYVVNGTRDKRGITLSVADDNSGLQISIPVEDILNELRILVGE